MALVSSDALRTPTGQRHGGIVFYPHLSLAEWRSLSTRTEIFNMSENAVPVDTCFSNKPSPDDDKASAPKPVEAGPNTKKIYIQGRRPDKRGHF